MTEIELFNYIQNNLQKLVALFGITNVEDYYELTDYKNPQINSLSEIPQVFAQYILHAQNGTMISNVVNFSKNYDFLKNVLCDFNPSRIKAKYNPSNNNDRETLVSKLVNDLRYIQSTNSGLKWDGSKSSKRPDSIIKRFANSVFDGVDYFSRFATKEAVLQDLRANYPSNNYKSLIHYLLSNFKHGFSVALCCDFLKELDSTFDLPKPDVHIMDVMAKYKDYNKKYYLNKPFECIDDVISVVTVVKSSMPDLTVYKFDRMIWLACTGNFFLSNTSPSIKDNLLNGIH